MFHLTSRIDTVTVPRPAVSAHDCDAPMQNRQRGKLPGSTRSLHAIALCVFAWFGCWSPLLGQTPDDEIPPSFSGVSGVVPLKRSKKYSNLWGSHSPRLSVLYQTRNGVGYDQGFWSLQSFVPFAHQCNRRVTFVDLHGLFNEDGALGGNFGFGHRVYLSGMQATVGGYVYYDYRDTGFNKFQQISPGLDVFGNGWELHANGYIPTIAETRQSLPDQFRGFSLFLDRFESSMSGADIELGVQLPLLEKFQPKLFAGAYTFDASGRRDATGWKTRLEASPADALGVAFSLQDDKVFGTTANFGVEFRFAGRSVLGRRPFRDVARGLKARPSQVGPRDYLAGSTRRLNQIVIDREEGLIARDPITGDPIRFLHVAAGGNSNGSFEDPYARLTDALADPRYLAGDVDVLYVRGGFHPSVTHTGDFAIVDGTQLLANGPLQTIDTQLGARVLPFSGMLPFLDEMGDTLQADQLPTILGRVSLGNDTTLSGFSVAMESAPATGFNAAILANGVTRFDINNNVAFNPTGGISTGILVANINDGLGRITGNRTNGNSNDQSNALHQTFGIRITDSPLARVDITRNESSNNEIDGILVANRTTLLGDITDNTTNGNRNGIAAFSESTIIGDIADNTASRNRQTGIIVAENSNMIGNVANNTTEENARSGIEFFSSSLTGSVTDNAVSGEFTGGRPTEPNDSRLFTDNTAPVTSTPIDSDSFGISFVDSVVDGDISRNQSSENSWAGIFIQRSTFTGNITDNETFLNFSDGIAIHDSVFTGDIANNMSIANFFGGIYVENTTFTGNVINNNVIANSAQGIAIVGGLPFEGAISGNDIANNFSDGMVVSVPTFTGIISDNISELNDFSGISLFVDTLNADIIGNQVSFNGVEAQNFGTIGRGISVRSFSFDPITGTYLPGTFNGDIANNTVLANFSVGIEIDDHVVTGNILNNISNDTNEHGIFIRDTVPSFTGNVSGNTTNNDGLGGIGISTPIFIGDIANNIANMNAGSGGIAVGIFGTLTEFTGNIFGNTANSNTQSGGILVSSPTFTGNITDNVTLQNADYGISLERSTFIGDIARNTSNLNSLSGIDIFRSDLTGNVTGNTTNQNTLYGILVSTSSLNGAIFGNTSQSNSFEGIALALDGNSNVIAENNVLSGNNFGGSEFFAGNQGTGTFNLLLNGNSSTNVVPAGQFNFDLINSGGGFFNLTPANVNDVNIGTVGSSDGSVTIP